MEVFKKRKETYEREKRPNILKRHMWRHFKIQRPNILITIYRGIQKGERDI